jgi:4-nitrophenyl phosphatase
MIDFSTIHGVILDMDGVLWRGDEPLPGMADLFAFFQARGIRFVLATNNSSRTPADYVAKLGRLDICGVEAAQIVTSGTATVIYLQSRYPQGSPVHVLGGDGLKEMITRAGFVVSDKADVVVVGIDFAVTYDKLKRAALLIRKGATFIGTNADATFPLPEGLVPGAGSLLAAISTATSVEPIVMGKPNAPMYEAGLRVLDTDAGHTLMVGDRLDTDILGAQKVGLRAALMLTGVTTRTELSQSKIEPDGVYAELGDLIAAWEL